MKVSRGNYEGFECIILEWMDYKLAIAPSIGGRIISYSFRGAETFYVMPSLKGKTFDLSLRENQSIDEKRKELGMKLYGGFKTWLAPQDLWQSAPYVDLDLGPYSADIREQGNTTTVSLTSPICRQTGIQFFRKVSIHADHRDVVVEMGMRNHGAETVEFGLWDVTQVVSPGAAYFPVGPRGPKLRTFWGTMPESAQFITDDLVKIDCRQLNGAFKVGTAHSEGWMLGTVVHGNETIGYLKRFDVFADGGFGHQCAVEVYNSGEYDYFEMEVHTPVVELGTGGEYSTTQIWRVFPLDEGFEQDILEVVRGSI